MPGMDGRGPASWLPCQPPDNHHAVVGACVRVAWTLDVGAVAPAFLRSGDADGNQASPLRHAVGRMDGAAGPGRPAPVHARAQPAAEHLLESADGSFGSGSAPCNRGFPLAAAPLEATMQQRPTGAACHQA